MPVLKLQIILLLLFISPLSHAGKLSDFEKDINQSKKSKREAARQQDNCKNCDSGGSWFFDILFDGILGDSDNSHNTTATESLNKTAYASEPNELAILLKEGVRTSKQRIGEDPREPGISERKDGEIILPFYRLNINNQRVDNQIKALDFKMELGKGVNGFEARTTKYRDDQANEDLRYSQFQYFHRMSFGNKIGVNLGVGYARMDISDSFDGPVYSLPILFQNGRHFGVEIRPSYFDADGVGINELDFSILYTHRKMAFRLGHRSIESANIDIDGAYIGLDFIF